jgi:hypothetical protein
LTFQLKYANFWIALLKLGEKMLGKLITGFPLLFLNGFGGITAYRLLGVPFHITLSFTIIYWTGTLIITYYGTDWAIRKMIRWKSINCLIKILNRWWKKVKSNLRFGEKTKEKGVFWLVNQKNWVTLTLNFIPLPQLPTITIIAARLLKIKKALPILFLGNIFRAFILTAIAYQLFPAL